MANAILASHRRGTRFWRTPAATRGASWQLYLARFGIAGWPETVGGQQAGPVHAPPGEAAQVRVGRRPLPSSEGSHPHRLAQPVQLLQQRQLAAPVQLRQDIEQRPRRGQGPGAAPGSHGQFGAVHVQQDRPPRARRGLRRGLRRGTRGRETAIGVGGVIAYLDPPVSGEAAPAVGGGAEPVGGVLAAGGVCGRLRDSRSHPRQAPAARATSTLPIARSATGVGWYPLQKLGSTR